MIRTIETDGLKCTCCTAGSGDKIAYVLYPMEIPDQWIESASRRYALTMVVVTGMDWESVFSPWPAKGVPKGSPDFQGRSPEFLKLLNSKVIPQIEATVGVNKDVERTLIGVSMSGLFALWQWIECNTFRNIASLSGSFWYEGFVDWMSRAAIPHKEGMGYFLLGEQEPHSKVKAFSRVGDDTRDILKILRQSGVRVEFQSVPGNHYSDPIPRLDSAMAALYQPAMS